MGAFGKAVVGVAAAVVLSVGASSPAGAEELPVSGTFTGTGGFSSEPCSFIPVQETGTGELTSLGSVTFVMAFCTIDAPQGVPNPIADGEFTVTSAEGTLVGDLTGTVEAQGMGPEFPLHFVWTVIGGTGRFDGATGSLALEGAFGLGAFTVSGTIDGVVDVRPPMPATMSDCMHGGWRHFGDENGDAFRNQGQCIAFVNHHS
jgi:hypothetical protein